MPPIPSFSAKDCLRALEKLGFSIDYSKGKGGHVKAYAPSNVTIRQGQRPFIIVPLHGKFRLQHAIIRELRQMGIPSNEFLKVLKH